MPFRAGRVPERIVCLTEEPTELLYLLGEERRIVGVSAYSVRPEGVRKRHPVVSAFLDGSLKKILDLEPDLVIGFSDIQAELAAKLIRNNLPVVIFNQRTVQEILDVILTIGAIVGAQEKAQKLVESYVKRLSDAEEQTKRQHHRPKVYFEEWSDPIITGIGWVSELIELAGGHDVFSHLADKKNAQDRIIEAAEVIERQPEIVIACWCGKPFKRDEFLARDGFDALPAVRTEEVHELDPAIILQPGPACLTDGLDSLERYIRPVAKAMAHG